MSSHTYSILVGTTVAFLLVFSLFSLLALSTTPMTCIKHDRIRHIITSLFLCFYILYDVSVKSINCVCARTNKQFILIDTPNTENGIKWCEHAILWEFEVFEDCGNCIAMEQSGYISEWQNLLLTLTSLYESVHCL